MFSLCTRVENIIIDIDSYDNRYLENQSFVKLLYELKEKYNLLLLGTKIDSFIETKVIKTTISKDNSFSSFMNQYMLIPMHTIVITSSLRCLEQAHRFNLSTILLFEAEDIDDFNQLDHKHLPDIILDIETIGKLLLENEQYGIFNELSIQQIGGSKEHVYPLGEIHHQLERNVKANLMFAGRYFVYGDPRSYIHCLSNMILRLKKFKTYAAEGLANCLNTDIKLTRNMFYDIELITVVPSKPGQDNHLDLLLNHTKLNEFRSIIDTNLLYTIREYSKQKQAGSFTNRATNVLNAFDSRKNISGHVLLIDDILTSGSTAMECAKVLYKYGAERVTILPLAIMQSNSNAPLHGKVTDQFDVEYRLNFRISDGSPFWVASDGEFLKYSEGKELYLSQNSYEDYQDDELLF